MESMKHLPIIAAIAAGGAIGAVARWAISMGVHKASGVAIFPLGTLVVNLVGCVAIGFCYIYFQQRGTPPEPSPRLSFISVGFIGALTTFSTYTIESLDLVEKGLYSYAFFNVVGSVVLGLAAAVIGILLGKLVSGT